MKYCYFFIFLFFPSTLFAQSHLSYKTLFIGNSYTYVNDLPSITSSVASSMGDTLLYETSAQGGYTLQQHSTDPTSLNKIAQGDWDFVVLQEQSQLPAFPDNQVVTDVYPYAKELDSLIHAADTCTNTIFYMTWGRQNGDASNCASFPPICTYNGMDSMLRLRYINMADSNHALLSPVGAVWHYIRNNFPAINLYQSDESHPTPEGSYAGACTFYTMMFRKNPTLINYNYSISAATAANIRTAVKTVVYDSLLFWHVGEYDPKAAFSYTTNGPQIILNNNSQNASQYIWSFGDGNVSNLPAPSHTYSANGVYQVQLIASRCGRSDNITQSIIIQTTAVGNIDKADGFQIFPNPVKEQLTISSAMFLKEKYRFEIVNLQGAIITISDAKLQQSQSIATGSLAAGIYFIKIKSMNGEVFYKKFIKE